MQNKIFVYQILVIGLLLVSVFSCKKDKNNDVKIDNEILIINKWKLTGLVNIADEWKYLNAILEIKNNQQYIFIDNTGDTSTSGNWNLNITKDSLAMTNYGLWCYDSLITYRIIQLDQTELKLMEHYTLDGKDDYLSYYFTKVN